MYKYDFGLSFAGSQRAFAKGLATALQEKNIKVFYDDNKQADLWGTDMYQGFQRIYEKECRFFIPLISEDYLNSIWPKHELKQAQARAIKSDEEYILPIRFDKTELPGLNHTINYIDAVKYTIEDIVELCLKKLAISLGIVTDKPVMNLMNFLRRYNPKAIDEIRNNYEAPITLRVAINRSKELQDIYPFNLKMPV